MNARALTLALGGRWHSSYGTARCPAHEDRNPSLQISDGETAVLLKCHAGCETRDVINALKAGGLWPDHDPARPPYKRPGKPLQRRPDDGAIKRSQAARRLWNSAVAPQRTPVAAYLAGRGITADIPPSIRYLAGAKHSDTGLVLPCMIAAVTRWPSQEVAAIHRTFLRVDGKGKAPVSSPKKMLGPVAGGAVRLAKHGSTLVVCEGIENAMSVLQTDNRPVWAALSTGGLESLIIPDDVQEVIIAADNDGPGLKAANKAAHKWWSEGKKVRIATAVVAGWDFNDLLTAPKNLAFLRQEKSHG